MKASNFEFENQSGESLTKPEKAQQLRESFAKKVNVVITLKRDIENQEISSLSPEEFDKWKDKRIELLGHEFPEAQKALEELKQKDEELQLLKSKQEELNDQEAQIYERAFAAYKQAEPQSSEEDVEEVELSILCKYFSQDDNQKILQICDKESALGMKMSDLEEENRRTLFSSENPFLYTSLHFLDNISDKRKKVENLKVAYQKGADEFVRVTGLHDAKLYFQEKFDNLRIEFTPYDIVVYITKEDQKKFFNNSFRGWHSSGTPFCFVVLSDNEEQQNYTRTHEIGHNRVESLKVAGMHNTVYAETSQFRLQEQMWRLQNLKSLKTPGSIIENTEEVIKSYIRNQIYYLNGEISADVENIAAGRLSAFYNHFANTASALEKLVRIEPREVEDEVKKMVGEEIRNLEEKTGAFLKEILFFSHLAKKYDKQNELSAIMVMDSNSTRLLRRFFSEELGDSFAYEKYLFELVPETTLPEDIHQRVYDMAGQSGPFSYHFGNLGSQRGEIIPPKTPLPLNKNELKQRNYFKFEWIFAEQYLHTDLLSPERIENFLGVMRLKPVQEVDERVVNKLRGLLEGYMDNGNFFPTFDSFAPKDSSAKSWGESISQIRKFESNIVELCQYVGLEGVGQANSNHIYETTVYKALQASVMDDDPTPLKQVFEQWKIQIRKDEYFRSGTFLGRYDVKDWFNDLEKDDVRNILRDKFLNAPEQTHVYQYLVPILEAQETKDREGKGS